MLNVWKNLGVHLWTTYLIFFVKSIVDKNKNLNKKCWFFFWHAKSTVEKKKKYRVRLYICFLSSPKHQSIFDVSRIESQIFYSNIKNFNN